MTKNLRLLIFMLIAFPAAHAQLTESFDGITFPPPGWLNVHTTGANASAIWTRAGADAFLGDDVNQQPVVTINPRSGAGMASFTSYTYAAGNGAHLISPALNFSSGGPHLVKFWMYRDNVYTNQDSVSVYINTSANTTGASFLGKIIRKKTLAPIETGPDGWYQYSFDIPGTFNTATNYLIFSAVSGFGNNLFIDDVLVEPQPSCAVPGLITTSAYTYLTGTASASWVASNSAVITGYQWAVNTTGIAPVGAGTAVAGNSATISGITPDVVNYLFVRTACGGGNFSTWTSLAFAALPCATLTAPANAATGVPQNQVFAWDALTGATAYNFYLGVAPNALTSIGSLAGNSVPISNLFPGQTYYWYILPSIGGIAAINPPCTVASFTIAPEGNNPPNNTCGGAVVVSAGNISGNPITGTTLNANLTFPADPCNNDIGSADDDVWYEFTTGAATPPAGTITITPTPAGGITDIVAQVYAATSCATVNLPATCADATTGVNSEQVDLSVLNPNTRYFLRIYSYANTVAARGGFTIVTSTGNSLPVSLADFTARLTNGVNILGWSTAQEINSRHFEVERSRDGRAFAAIGQVAAAGNSNTRLGYRFTDNRPNKGVNYYRLRVVDKDNTFTYSDVRSVRNEGRGTDISIYPNPVQDRLRLNFNADNGAKGSLAITDLGGKILYSGPLTINTGNTAVAIPVGGLAAGTYLVKIQLNEEVVIKKFNKQ